MAGAEQRKEDLMGRPALFHFARRDITRYSGGMFKKAALAVITLAIIFALGLVIGFLALRWLQWGRGSTFNSAALLTQVQNLGQLVTVKYVIEKVEDYDDAKWYGDNRVILIAHGVVKAGIDLRALQPGDIKITDKKIRIALPPPRVTDVYLDDRHSEILERSTGLLRTFDKDLEETARVQAVEDLRRAASENGILTDASTQATVELTALLHQLGFTDVEFCKK
jgi:hypothetical protein